MAIPKRHIERIKWSVLPSKVIGEYVKLVRRGQKGSMEWIGECPFHGERTPSFTVTDKKNFYHCFGCGSNGSVIDFLMKHQELSLIEALLKVASISGVKIPSGKTKVTKKKIKDRKRYARVVARKTRYQWDLDNDIPF
jgi:DNA primase